MKIEKTSKRPWILIHSLIISGTLNVALIATFAFKEYKEDVLLQPAQEKISKGYLKNVEVLEEFLEMSYDDLVRNLYDETHIEEGQRRCDLALAALAAFHEFDIGRAFAGYPIEKRKITFGDRSLVLFSGINSGRFEGIRHFARTEMWPLTAKGLFQEVKKREVLPVSLKEAFSLTTEYFLIKRAFGRLPYVISNNMLFDLLVAGNWEEIRDLAHEIQESSDGKIRTFSSFLLPKVEKGSNLAAYLMVLLEEEFALKELSDKQLEMLISLLSEKTPEVELFLQKVASGIRCDQIQKLAGKPLENPPRRYIVQAGDSLWKISRKFNVKVEKIQEINALNSENLKPGTELILPAIMEVDRIHQSAKGGI